MASYQILYWQELPSQIKVTDGFDEETISLEPEYMERIDEAAAERNCSDEDSYLEGWKWGELIDREGSMEEVGEAVVKELNEKYQS